jgi:hypothetical protein
MLENIGKRLYYKLRFGINFRQKEVKTMLTTVLKFESSKGTSLIGTVDTENAKEFQKLQKHIIQALTKMGDDIVDGNLKLPELGAKLTTQAVAVISMETMGTGANAGWYSKTSQESRFDHTGTYEGFVDFSDSLLKDVLSKWKGHGHGK